MPGYSFKGHTFLVSRSGEFTATPPPPVRIEERAHVPYSDVNIIDDGGDGLSIWQATIYCTAAERTAILNDRGTVGQLVTPDHTYANTNLSQIGSQSVTLDRT